MSYLYSNEPYQRVDESQLAKHMAIAAGMTAAITGTMHAGLGASASLIRRRHEGRLNRVDQRLGRTLQAIDSSGLSGSARDIAIERARTTALNQGLKLNERYESSRIVRNKNRFFGSGLRGFATYGAASLIGAGLGAAYDLTSEL